MTAPAVRARARWTPAGLVWRYLAGRVSRPFVLGLVGPLSILCFAVGAALAVAHFPTSYDIRHRWISTLASARSNPNGHAYLGIGLVALAAVLAPLPGYLRARLRELGWRATAAALLLWVGIVGLALLGVEIAVFPNPGRTRTSHHVFTTMTFIGLTGGFLAFAVASTRRRGSGRVDRCLAALACAVLAMPGTIATVIYVTRSAHATRTAEALTWAAAMPGRELPFLLKLAFWEWTAVAGLFVGGYLCAWAASRDVPDPAPRIVLQPTTAEDARSRRATSSTSPGVKTPA